MAKHGRSAQTSPQFDRARLDRAMAEGRFQQALELAKQLYKQERIPEHLQILKDAYLGRARQQVSTGHSRDAVATLNAAAQLDLTDGTWQGALATTLAAAGGIREALGLLDHVSPTEADRVRAQVVDGALRLNTAGRDMLPATLHADFDRVLQAFAQIAAGQDEAVRETLQGIGLRSPFQEWKVLLRGMQAWYANDDIRALEIWQRLDPARLPVQLAAPFRARLEPSYLAAQPAAMQNRLARQYERFADTGLIGPLRIIRAEMENKRSLAQGFRHAENLLPLLQKQAPRAVAKLANAFYWAILETGPEDATRYKRVFGAPAEDPNFNRLRALAGDRHDDNELAHEAWQRYEQDLSSNAVPWPDDQRKLARALIWQHLAEIAIAAEKAVSKGFFDELDDEPAKPRALNPSAEKCFQKSIELASDHLQFYVDLLEYQLTRKWKKKAEKAARNLLQRFPDHSPTLEKLASLLEDSNPAEALELLSRAQRANPLDPALSAKVFEAYLQVASRLTAQNEIAEARRHLDLAASLDRNHLPGRLLTLRAVVAFKAGADNEAEELLVQANAASGLPLLVSFLLAGESVRSKLDWSLKTRFSKEFQEAIGSSKAARADIVKLARFVTVLPAHCREYHGSATHIKKIIKHLQSVKAPDASEAEWRAITVALGVLGAGIRALRRSSQAGQRQFPTSPIFYLAEAEAIFKHGKVDRSDYWPLNHLVSEAEQLARAMPHGEQRDHYLSAAGQLLEKVNALNPYAAMMNASMGGYFSSIDEDLDDDDDMSDMDDGDW